MVRDRKKYASLISLEGKILNKFEFEIESLDYDDETKKITIIYGNLMCIYDYNAEKLFQKLGMYKSVLIQNKKLWCVISKNMTKKQWYESLFENYSEKYDKESFTQGTLGECDFIETELGWNKSLKILDVGCGTGRHSIELTKRRYNVTGIDLSEAQLARAREKAHDEKLKIDFQKQDARNLKFNDEFDVAIMLCEGGFPLMETDEMNYEILKSVTKSLKEKCKFIFTTLNGLFPLYHSIEKFLASETEDDNAKYRNNTFDLMTFRDYNITEFEDDSGNKMKLECNERYYVPSEITWLLKSLGYKKVDIYGAKLGAFSRNDKLSTKDFEMLVIAEK